MLAEHDRIPEIALEWHRQGKGAALATVVETWGSAPRPTGSQLAVSGEAERLRLSCRRLIWLNPLLRWEGFEARAQGVRALLPHVDTFVSAHNIASIERLAETIALAEGQGEKPRLMRDLRA